VLNRAFESCVASLIVCLLAAPAVGNVSLALSDNDATPTSAVLAPDGTVTLSVRLTATSEQTTGLDYYLRASGPGADAGLFTITGRSVAGSFYPMVYSDDAIVLTPANAILNPESGADLGGGVPNVNSPLGPGTYLVNNLTLKVSASTPPGVYTIQTFSPPNTGWIGASPFPESEFNAQGSFTITVPEPASLALLALAAGTVIRRRSRSAR
jgi:hypothetical protein